MNENFDFGIIRAYLTHRLDTEQKLAFETRLHADPVFAEVVRMQQIALAATRYKWKQEMKDYQAAPGMKVTASRGFWLRAAIFAGLCFATGYWGYKYFSPRPFAHNQEQQPGQENTGAIAPSIEPKNTLSGGAKTEPVDTGSIAIKRDFPNWAAATENLSFPTPPGYAGNQTRSYIDSLLNLLFAADTQGNYALGVSIATQLPQKKHEYRLLYAYFLLKNKQVDEAIIILKEIDTNNNMTNRELAMWYLFKAYYARSSNNNTEAEKEEFQNLYNRMMSDHRDYFKGDHLPEVIEIQQKAVLKPVQ